MDLTTRTPAGWLMRIRGPEGALEPPTALIQAGARANLDLACLATHVMAMERLDPLPVHLCVEAETLREAPDRVAAIVSESCHPVYLTLDAALLDPGSLVDGLQTLRGVGALIALKGVGYGLTPVEALAMLQPEDRPEWPARLLRHLHTAHSKPIAAHVNSDPMRRTALRMGIGLGYGPALTPQR